MYCAYITTLKGLRKHNNADRLQCVEVFGQNVIVDLSYQEGQKVVFFPSDGQLSLEYATDNNLVRKKDENGNNIGGEYEDDGIYIPQFCTSYTQTVGSWEDEWEQTDNFPIKFCPHCGEKIEISVVDKIDVSDKYEELTKQRDELWERCQRTDSKKKESELREQVGKLDKQIDSFYWLDEWKGEYYYGSI